MPAAAELVSTLLIVPVTVDEQIRGAVETATLTVAVEDLLSLQ